MYPFYLIKLFMAASASHATNRTRFRASQFRTALITLGWTPAIIKQKVVYQKFIRILQYCQHDHDKLLPWRIQYCNYRFILASEYINIVFDFSRDKLDILQIYTKNSSQSPFSFPLQLITDNDILPFNVALNLA